MSELGGRTTPLGRRDLATCAHAVYRIYGEDGCLLYVGMTCDPDERLRSHGYNGAGWVAEYHHHAVTWYGSRTEAEAAEQAAIKSEHPAYNVLHNRPVKLSKPVRITLDLDRETYDALNQWLGLAAAEVGAPVSKAQALRAMIKAAAEGENVAGAAIDLLRQDSARPDASSTTSA